MTTSPEAPVRFGDLGEYNSILIGALTGNTSLVRSNGEYTNIQDWLYTQRDGLIYSVDMPSYSYSTSTACIKDDSNAGLVIEPSSNTLCGRDDYAGRLAFLCKEVNGYIDADGMPHVTAMDGDEWFRRDGSNGDVWVLAPVLYKRSTVTPSGTKFSISDTPHDGFDVQPGGKLPGGSVRPFILYAKYAGVKYDGKLASVSGLPLWNRNVSQNALVDMAAAKGQGYAGKTVADDWYVTVMYVLKYASKSSQSTFAGCTGYTTQCNPAVAENGVKRVLIPTSTANGLVVGSSMMLGTSSTDRNAAGGYDVFDATRITRIELVDASNSAVYFDLAANIDTATSMTLSTAPYHSGFCDNVQGTDGSPFSRTNGKEPFLLQNIECSVGAYEVLADIIMDAKALGDGTLLEQIYRCYDSQDYSKSSVANYVDTGRSLPIAASDGWSYSLDIDDVNGFLLPVGYGGTSTTGTGDGVYQNVSTSKGLREWRGVGNLSVWSVSGLLCVHGDAWLARADWDIAGRLSGLGRTAA